MRGRKVKYSIRKGDTVQVISGDHRGSRGKVLSVYPETGRVLVEGVNLVKKHLKKSQEHPEGGIVDLEAPFAISKVRRLEKDKS